MRDATARAGYYMVKSDPADRYPKVVYCDMEAWRDDDDGGRGGDGGGGAGGGGGERVYGSPGNLRYFSAFDVSLKCANPTKHLESPSSLQLL